MGINFKAIVFIVTKDQNWTAMPGVRGNTRVGPTLTMACSNSAKVPLARGLVPKCMGTTTLGLIHSRVA